jgi:hypothetical protein
MQNRAWWVTMGTWLGLSACGYPALPPLTTGDASAAVDGTAGPPASDAPGIDAPIRDAPGIDAPPGSDAGQLLLPSCAGLAASCGPHGSDSCCNSPLVDGGTFFRGLDSAGLGDHQSPANISAFRLDNYEVSVGRFRAFVDAGKGIQSAAPAIGTGAHPARSDTGCYDNPCTDCVHRAADSGRTMCGGGFAEAPAAQRSSNRISNAAVMRNYVVGFRCARAP